MNTNQIVQSSNPNESSSGPIQAKRKRGRPRKYPKLGAGDNSRISKLHRTRWEQNPGPPQPAPPPGFGPANGNPTRQPVADPPDPMVGRAVSGVIEAVFEAGYLLNVRVADSAMSLRGVVFRPARIVPITPENDVAPNVPMIRRIDPNPAQGGARGPPAVVSRGTFVPVVLEPVRDSNGSARVPSLGAEATAAVLSNGTKSPTPPPAAVVAQFENLVTEVVKRIEAPVEKIEDESDDADEALEVEPLRAVLINDEYGVDNVGKVEKIESAPVQIDVDRTSKMSQLLEGPISESPAGQDLEAKMTETPSVVITEHVDKEPDTVGEGNITQESFF